MTNVILKCVMVVVLCLVLCLGFAYSTSTSNFGNLNLSGYMIVNGYTVNNTVLESYLQNTSNSSYSSNLWDEYNRPGNIEHLANSTNLTIGKTVYITSGERICWDGPTCSHSTYYNGTALIEE